MQMWPWKSSGWNSRWAGLISRKHLQLGDWEKFRSSCCGNQIADHYKNKNKNIRQRLRG